VKESDLSSISWEQRKLGDLLQTLPFKQFLKEPEPDGKYEIIQQGNEPVIGFANGTPCGDYKDVVIFGDHTLSLYKPQHPFFVATDGVRIVKGQQDTDGYYLLSLLERYKPQSEGYKRYYSILADTNCNTTYNTSEQEKIGAFFKLLDSLITLHQSKSDSWKNKKNQLSTISWEQRKLSELVERYEDPVETPHDGYIRLGIRSHAKGTFHEYVEPGHELETAQMHRVAANKLIFNITFAWEHAVAITDKNDAGKLVSHRFPQFTLLDLIRPEFLKYVILDEDFHHNLYLASPGGAGRNRVLKIDEALDYPIYYPSADEQHKIGVFLDKLSDLITLHQRMKNLLVNQ
jgi:restriction endonuclease S subunit